MTEMIPGQVPGLSAAVQHYLQQGAREFFGRQPDGRMTVEYLRRRGDIAAGMLAVPQPGTVAGSPAVRQVLSVRGGACWMYRA
jgi:hypothetical protein